MILKMFRWVPGWISYGISYHICVKSVCNGVKSAQMRDFWWKEAKMTPVDIIRVTTLLMGSKFKDFKENQGGFFRFFKENLSITGKKLTKIKEISRRFQFFYGRNFRKFSWGRARTQKYIWCYIIQWEMRRAAEFFLKIPPWFYKNIFWTICSQSTNWVHFIVMMNAFIWQKIITEKKFKENSRRITNFQFFQGVSRIFKDNFFFKEFQGFQGGVVTLL